MTANETKWNDRFIYIYIYIYLCMIYMLWTTESSAIATEHLGGVETKRERERHAIDTKPTTIAAVHHRGTSLAYVE